MRKSIQHLASNHMAHFVVAAGQPLETVLMWWPRSPASIFFLLRRHRRATAEKPGQRVCDQPVSEGSRSRAPCTSESSPASSFDQKDTYRKTGVSMECLEFGLVLRITILRQTDTQNINHPLA
jgi:hypothetical protein